MKYQFIDAHRSEFRLKKMCRVIKASGSGYYKWRSRNPSKKSINKEELLKKINKIYVLNEGIYGSPRIAKELNANGTKCSKNRVAQIMRENGIIAKTKKRFKVTTDSEHDKPVAPNILGVGNAEKITAPNQAWRSDITYIWTKAGWLYLAIIIDVFTRGIIGWSMSKYIKKQLVIDALLMAMFRKNPGKGVIFHSDRGTQYASKEVVKLLANNGFIQSMSGKGNCYDNAMAESFFHTLKVEKVYWEKYETREQAIVSIYNYIELYYNVKRRHSSIDYMSPKNYEALYYQQSEKKAI